MCNNKIGYSFISCCTESVVICRIYLEQNVRKINDLNIPYIMFFLQAVCCTDGKHCCPEGTTCDVSQGKCNRGDLTVLDWYEKVPAIVKNVVCPDGQSECKTGQTCCKLSTGNYGCCPIPKV